MDNKSKYFISFCIPTYNRAKELKELISSLIQLERDDIQIVVVDNCSSDETRSVLSSINSMNLKVIVNQSPIPAFENMIHSIYSGDGKYLFYINDRDVILQEKIDGLITFLKGDDYVFVHAKQMNSETKNEFHIYNSFYYSLLNHWYTHHPSGMIFNRDVLHKNLPEEKYKQYIKDQYPCSFLMRDCLLYGVSAIYDYGCWKQRPSTYLAKQKSGTLISKNLYFSPETIFMNIDDIYNQIFGKSNEYLDSNQKKDVSDSAIKFFSHKLIHYKYYSLSLSETAHYQIPLKRVSTIELCSLVKRLKKKTSSLIQEYNIPGYNYHKKNKLFSRILFNTIKASIRIDYERYVLRKKW